MPRDSNGDWSYLPGTEAVPNTTILSGPYNANLADIADNEFNAPRPVSKGGTGAGNSSDARTNLGIQVATTAEFLANVPDLFLDTDGVNASGAYLMLTYGASIPWNMAQGYNAYVTLAGTGTLAVPTNMVVGRSGTLEVIQAGSGGYNLNLAAGWKGGPVSLSTTVGAVDLVFYTIRRGAIPVITGIKRNVG